MTGRARDASSERLLSWRNPSGSACQGPDDLQSDRPIEPGLAAISPLGAPPDVATALRDRPRGFLLFAHTRHGWDVAELKLPCSSLSRQEEVVVPADLVIAGRLHRRPIGKECSLATAVGLKLRIVAAFVIRTVIAFGTSAVDGSAAAGIEFVTLATGWPRRRKPERASFLLDVIPDPPIIAPGAGNVDRRGFGGDRRLSLAPRRRIQLGASVNLRSAACGIGQQDACHRQSAQPGDRKRSPASGSASLAQQGL